MEKKKIKVVIFILGIVIFYCLSFSKIITGSEVETYETNTFYYPKTHLANDIDLPWAYSNGIPIYAGSGSQQYPQLCSDGNGGAIIVWLDSRGGTLKEIYVQRINYRGVSQWTDEGVLICTTCEEHERPQICSDGKGGAIITWMDDRYTPDIYAQYINSSGNIQWITNGIPICTGLWPKEDPQICSDGEGGAIITWSEDRDLTSNYQIYAQRVDSEGIAQWTINGELISTTGTYNLFPQICGDGKGGAIITWAESTNWNIYARSINFEGVLQSLEDIPICTENNAQLYPKICSDENGGAIITWQDHRSGIDIYAQRINSNGDTQWINNGSLISDWSDSSSRPELCPDGNGGAIITWSQGSTNIYAQRINFSGDIQWVTNGIPICLAIDYQHDPQIARDGNEGAFITWSDHRNGNSDIYAQQVNSTGHIQGPTNGFPICIATNVQTGHQICSGGRGNAIIAWIDDRFDWGTYDIFGQKIREKPSIKILSPKNNVYTEPMDGYYPATYSFENDNVGDNPFDWETIEDGGPIEVIYSLDNHFHVVELDDNTGAGNDCVLTQNFNSQIDGIVEFYFRLDSLGTLGRAIRLEDIANQRAIHLKVMNNEFYYRDGSNNWHAFYSNFQINTWYHIRIDFDCATDTFDIFVNENQQGANLEFNNPVTYIENILFITGQDAIVEMHLDAIGYSWDLNYNVGDNLNEGLLLSFESPIDFDSTAYSLDEQDPISILGSTVLPMLIDGPHTIRVLGNDSLGYLFQSEIENFAVDTEIPELLVHSPNQNDIFGLISPKFNVSIIDENLVSSWYTLDNGITNISFTATEGYIDQDAWSAASNGAINITFYVKDIGDHLIHKEITVIKRVIDDGGKDGGFLLLASIIITALSSGAIVSSIFILWQRRKRKNR